ncbi:MAG: DoxX family membrane protein [Proteobacteria bacterium]|nr:DoxX family membrane protein [Pseudomonadota bacterium]MBU1741613.1 DoxX family membrane protein [Pseudomonadota bacterium]
MREVLAAARPDRPSRPERLLLALTLAALAVWGLGFELGRVWTPGGLELAGWLWSWFGGGGVLKPLGAVAGVSGLWAAVDTAAFALIFIAAGLLAWWIMRLIPFKWLILAARLYLGYVFVDAAVEKILYPQVFASTMTAYDLFPHALVNLASLFLPWLELLTGLGLILGVQARLMAFLLSGMLGWFLFAIIVNIFRGNSFDCGCGTAGDDALGWGVVWRDVYMLGIALTIFLFDRGFLSMDRLFRRRR